MNFETWLLHPKVQTVGWALLHFIWQGALLAAILALTDMLTRPSQSRLRYAIGCFLMLLMPAVFIATVLSTGLSSARSWPSQRAVIPESKTAPSQSVRPKSLPETPSPMQVRIPTRIAPKAQAFAQKIDVLPGGVVCLWLIGFVGFSIYTAAGWTRAQLLRRRGIEPADPR